MSGRIRTIKPELLEDAVTAGLSETAFRLFVGMILLADDYGVLRAEPAYLAGQIFWKVPPSKPIDEAFGELSAKLVQVYDAGGQRYAFIAKWEKHQKVSHRGKRRLPEPPDILVKSPGESPEILRPDLRPGISDQRPGSGSREDARTPEDANPEWGIESERASGVQPISPPRTDLGGLESEAYAEGLALATGAPCAAPRGATNAQALRDALRVHGPKDADAEARRVWLRDAARDYAKARKGGQLSPRWFVEWLDSGKPAARASPRILQQSAGGPESESFWEKRMREQSNG